MTFKNTISDKASMAPQCSVMGGKHQIHCFLFLFIFKYIYFFVVGGWGWSVCWGWAWYSRGKQVQSWSWTWWREACSLTGLIWPSLDQQFSWRHTEQAKVRGEHAKDKHQHLRLNLTLERHHHEIHIHPNENFDQLWWSNHANHAMKNGMQVYGQVIATL